jgi:hypothetical protein
MWVMVPRTKEALLIPAVRMSMLTSDTDSLKEKKKTALRTVTVAMKEKVVHAVLHSFSAETL